MTSFNAIATSFKSLLQPAAPRRAEAAAGVGAVVGMKADALVRPAGGARGAIQTIDRALMAGGEALAAIAKQVVAARENGQQLRLVVELQAVQDKMEGLRALRGEAVALARNPRATEADGQKMGALAAEAAQVRDGGTLAKINHEAKDVARNAGRNPISDRGLFAATANVVERRNQVVGDIKTMAREAEGLKDVGSLVGIQARLDGAKAYFGKLSNIQTQLDAIADNPKAKPETLDRAKALAAEAVSVRDPQRLARIGTELEDLARNVGRNPASDRGLYAATQALGDARASLESERRDIAKESGGVRNAGMLLNIQARLADATRAIGEMDKAKASLDKLADNPNATPADVQRASALAAQLGTVRDPGTQAKINLELEDLARNSGRAVPSDRGLFYATLGLADREASLNGEMKAKMQKAQGVRDQGTLMSLQMDLEMIQTSVGLVKDLKVAADRLADNPNASPAALDKMKALLAEATQIKDQGTLMRVVAEAQQIARQG